MRRSRLGVPWQRVYLTVLPLLAVLGIVIYVVKQKRETESTRAMSLPVVDQQPELKKAMSSSALKRELLTTRVGRVQLQRIPAGGFRMGSPSYRDQPEVRISRPFYLGVQEVTQGQYHAVMGENPSYFKGSKDRPVETVSWLDAVKFCNKLSEQEGVRPFYEIEGENVRVADWSGPGIRLPTAAEWEYACRAGSTTRYSFGDDQNELSGYAWFGASFDSGTHAVGQKRPNPWGLFDMHGNVSEWCWDWYDANYYNQMSNNQKLSNDPTGPPSGTARVLRGGSFADVPVMLYSAIHVQWPPTHRVAIYGLRVARN